jgi:putative ABC transport system substrate-binding protein
VASAFDAVKERQVEALIIPPDTTFYARRRQIAELAAKMNLPTSYGYRDHVEVGGLMSYGPDTRDQYRRAAAYVDKILKGASPADLPVEQPTKLQFLVNLTAAKTLGLNVPPTLVAQADEVIE